MEKDDYFEENIVTIIRQDGDIVNVKRNNNEEYHYQVFKRITDKIIPNLLDDLLLSIESYSGFDLSYTSAAKGNVVFMQSDFRSTKTIFLSVPNKITKEQQESTENILKKTKSKLLYIVVCHDKIDNPVLSDANNLIENLVIINPDEKKDLKKYVESGLIKVKKKIK